MSEKIKSFISKTDNKLISATVMAYLLFIVSTIIQNEFAIRLFSPITVGLTVTCIIACISRLERYRIPIIIVGLGISTWAIADIIRFVNEFVLAKEPLSVVVRTLYLVPNYCFGIAVVAYLFIKLERKELYRVIINTFVVTIIGYVFIKKLLDAISEDAFLDVFTNIRVNLYFFINFFIIALVVQLLFMVKRDYLKYRSSLIVMGAGAYVLFDFQYTYREALGFDPENPYLDIVYLFFMIVIAIGAQGQAQRKVAIELKKHIYTQRAIRQIGIVTAVAVVFDILALAAAYLTQTEFFYILIALLGYGIMTSVFQNNALAEQLLKQRDMLTGLYNTAYSKTVLKESVRLAGTGSSKFAVFCVDLNCFKPINDTYGHEMGDKVLHEYGQRLLALPEDWISFRTGGDEFMIIRGGLHEDSEITASALELQKIFDEPLQLYSYLFKLSSSIGISVYPDDSLDPKALIRYADTAMCQVKKSGRKDDYRLFDRSLIKTVESLKSLEEVMQKAEPENDFELYYQPQFNVTSGKLIGIEAFPRLKDHQFDDISAAEIIRVAEETGLMSRLGRWIAKEAISQINLWNTAFYHDLRMSINIAPLQLLDAKFLEDLSTITGKLKIKTGQINLDVQNEVLMGVESTAKDTLMSLHEYGFGLTLNDFGGGDVNLSYILDCGFSDIHISRKLISSVTDDLDDQTLVKTIVSICDEMSIEVSAVGVETEQQADLLRSFGINMMQGYYFGKPVDKETFMNKYLVE